jgi:putrescine---pyruvate transaminase
MRRLPYATGYFHFGSEPAIRLASKLADLAPADLNHVFFTLGGSDAVDTAIRMVRYYNNALGRTEKKHFIGLERGYHGSTSNGAGLTALAIFHEKFDLPRPWQHHIPSPYPYRHTAGPDREAITAACVQSLRAKVAEIGADRVAAFICEPVQGSGGVIVPPTGFLSAMQATCRELDILFVVDEVITGFGRTGPMFAAEHEGLMPDLMTLAKGLTAGYAPMGATLVSDRVYDVIADGASDGAPFGHGFTYSGHPVSAAIGLEVMRLHQKTGCSRTGRRSAPTSASGCGNSSIIRLWAMFDRTAFSPASNSSSTRRANGSRRKTSDLAPGCSTSGIGTVSSFALSRMTRSASLHPYASRQARSIF